MAFLLTNNAASALASGVSNSATSMTVTTGHGSRFPTPSGGDTFRATLVRASDSAIEIVDVTARSSDVMTVTRAQEGTTGLTLLTGDKFELRATASVLNEKASKTAAETLTNKTLTNPTVTNYVETVHAPAAGSSFTVDLANGTVQKLTTNANTTITLPSSVAGKSYLILVAYGGVHTITWAGGSTIKWSGGTAPTATSVNGKFDMFAFTCDGTNTYARSGGANY